MGCGDKIKYTCAGGKTFAACCETQVAIPEFSNLQEGCLSVEDVLADTYQILENIIEDIDISSVMNDCITFTEPKKISSIIEQMYSKICDLVTENNEQSALIEELTTRITNVENNNCP